MYVWVGGGLGCVKMPKHTLGRRAPELCVAEYIVGGNQMCDTPFFVCRSAAVIVAVFIQLLLLLLIRVKYVHIYTLNKGCNKKKRGECSTSCSPEYKYVHTVAYYM